MLRYRLLVLRGEFAGEFGFVASPRGLSGLYLPSGTRDQQVRRRIAAEHPDAREDRRLLPELARDLTAYFAGRPAAFDLPLDVPAVSDFEHDVWRCCRRVPYGQTLSYGQLAAAAGRPGAARAVGSCMRRNRVPIVIPCHRVLAAGGRLGGYSGPGGLTLKARLLELEQGPHGTAEAV